MFSMLSYKQKMWLILISGAFVFVLGYYFAITPTLSVWDKIEKEEYKIEKAKTAHIDIEKATKSLQVLRQKVGKTSPSFMQFQKDFLNSVVPFADKNKIKVSEIKLPHYAPKNGYEIQTMQLECKGSFKGLTQLLNHIQQENIGRVCSVNYELRKDHKLKREFLYATFFIQNYLAQ